MEVASSQVLPPISVVGSVTRDALLSLDDPMLKHLIQNLPANPSSDQQEVMEISEAVGGDEMMEAALNITEHEKHPLRAYVLMPTDDISN